MLINETLLGEVKQWRQQIHSQPELGFKEFKTSSFIIDKLQSFGIEVHQGLGGTGVVGVLKNGSGPTIGIRADIDALPIKEQNDIEHKSTHENCMHACGHDGHTSVLLGTAKHLSQHKNFSGTIYFIFQPAEEVLGGAKAMIDDGLFDKFPMDAVYGLHNWPGLPVGEIAVNNGPMMASFDTFEITLTGKGTHAAMPHMLTEMVAVLPPLYGVTGEMDYHIRYPVTTNDSQAYLEIKEAATEALGADKVNTDVEPSMASEDFSFMSQVVKGAYFWLGVDGSSPSKPLHNAAYDFNDDAIETGIKVWVSLIESQLPKMSA